MNSSELPDHLSDISVGADETDTFNQNGGGLFWDNNSSKNNRKALEAAFQGKSNVLEVLVMEDLVFNYAAKDSTDSTILHYIAKNKTLDPTNKLARKIINSNKRLLLIKDKNGDTPISLAQKTGNKGFLRLCRHNQEPLEELIVYEKKNTDDDVTVAPMNKKDIEKFFIDVMKSVSNEGRTTSSPQTLVYLNKDSAFQMSDTENIIQDLDNKLCNKQSGGQKLVDDTENLINELYGQLGGKKRKIWY